MEYTWFDLLTVAGIGGLAVGTCVAAAGWVYSRHKMRLHNQASANLITRLEDAHKAKVEGLEQEVQDFIGIRRALIADREANWIRKPFRDDKGHFARKSVVYNDIARQEQ